MMGVGWEGGQGGHRSSRKVGSFFSLGTKRNLLWFMLGSFTCMSMRDRREAQGWER